MFDALFCTVTFFCLFLDIRAQILWKESHSATEKPPRNSHDFIILAKLQNLRQNSRVWSGHIKTCSLVLVVFTSWRQKFAGDFHNLEAHEAPVEKQRLLSIFTMCDEVIVVVPKISGSLKFNLLTCRNHVGCTTGKLCLNLVQYNLNEFNCLTLFIWRDYKEEERWIYPASAQQWSLGLAVDSWI